jgi:hypothetical protein
MNNPEALTQEAEHVRARLLEQAHRWSPDRDPALRDMGRDGAATIKHLADCIDTLTERLREVEEALRKAGEEFRRVEAMADGEMPDEQASLGHWLDKIGDVAQDAQIVIRQALTSDNTEETK